MRAVVVERGRIAWAAERALDGPGEIAGALAELGAERPRGVNRVRVAIEGELVHVKLLNGFPRLAAAKLHRAAALHAPRWFLHNGTPLATGAVRLEGRRVLAAAVERDVLDALADGFAQTGMTPDGVGAAVGAWAPLLPDGAHDFVADQVTETVAVTGGRVQSLRRRRTVAAPPGSGGDGRSASVLGEIDPRFFTAYAAALRAPAPLFDTMSDAERGASWRRVAVRLAVAAALLWAAAGAVFGARVTTTLRRADAERGALGPALDAAVAVERDLALADEFLRAVTGAREARSADAALLSLLTAALPDSRHLSLLRRGRDGRVTLVGYAPSAARVLAALAGTPGIRDPALQSGITRETVAGRTRERFGIAFTWHAGDAP
jgi:hypothetical protein